MEARTSVVTLDSLCAMIVLHGEVVPDGSGTISNKIECSGEAASRKKVVK